MNLTPWPARRRDPTRRGIGWGIIGAGAVAARQFIPTLRRLHFPSPVTAVPAQRGSILGIYSSSETRGQAFAVAHAIPHAYLNLADLLAQPDIDCVYIANHPRHHAQAALAALAAGKHVLVEPPLGLDPDEAQRVAHTALSRGLTLAVNYTYRAAPAVRALREQLAEQTIGDLLAIRIHHTGLLSPARQTWRLRSPGGGVLLDRTQHSIDLLRYLLRDEIGAVYSAASPRLLGSTVEEDVLTQVTLRRHGVIAQLHDSFYLPHVPSCIEIVGSRGALTALHVWDDAQPTTLHLQRHGSTTAIPLPPGAPFELALQSFHAAVNGNAAALASGSDGVHSLVVVQAAAESLQTGRRVSLAAPSRTVIDRTQF